MPYMETTSLQARWIFIVWCTTVQSAVLQSHVVCLSVTLVDHDHLGCKSWKLIAWTIIPTSSLFVAQRSSTYSQGNMEKFFLCLALVCSFGMASATPLCLCCWIIPILHQYCTTKGHCAVIFAIAQLSCSISNQQCWNTEGLKQRGTNWCWCRHSFHVAHHYLHYNLLTLTAVFLPGESSSQLHMRRCI